MRIRCFVNYYTIDVVDTEDNQKYLRENNIKQCSNQINKLLRYEFLTDH